MGDNTRRSWAGSILYLLPLFAALALVVFLFQGTFYWWWWEWTTPGSFYAHALFVPFFVAVMIWRNRENLLSKEWKPSWTGIVPLSVGMALLLLARRSDVTTVASFAFMFMVLGIVILIGGLKRTKAILFPLLFILMMMPLIPDQLINSVAFPIQIASAKIAAFLLNLLTLHAVQEGSLIKLDSYRLAVELPCSGFKTLVSLLTFTAAFAYLVEGKAWKKWTLFFSTIPLSLFINALRITFIGIVGELISSKAASTFHDYSGFIVLILAFLFLFNFAKILRCKSFLGMPLDDDDDPGTPMVKKRVGDHEIVIEGPAPPWWKSILDWRPTTLQLRRVTPYVLAINAVLLITVGIQTYVIKPIIAKPPIGTTQVPLVFTAPNKVVYTSQTTMTGGGIGKGEPIDKLTKDIQETLNPSRIINREYVGSDGSRIGLFITAGNGRRVFHDPHTCMLGSDAILTDIGILNLNSGNDTVPIMETRFRRTSEHIETEMFMCYVVQGDVVPSTQDVRTKMIFQTLFGDGGMPSYFFRVTQLSPGTEEQRRAEIQNFVEGMWAQIGPVLKGKVSGDPNDPAPVPLSPDEMHP